MRIQLRFWLIAAPEFQFSMVMGTPLSTARSFSFNTASGDMWQCTAFCFPFFSSSSSAAVNIVDVRALSGI